MAIVGRANVGKSSLFNTIIGRREAIVAREPGTTRDRVAARASWQGKDFWLVDTAGLKAASDEFELTIQEQIVQVADSANIIIVVVEATVPITTEDRRVAKLALRTQKPVLLVINKIDKNSRLNIDEWLKLGIKTVLSTSTTQKTGIEGLLEALNTHLSSARIREERDSLQVALLGRPNVGKSSLFNKLANKQQAIVAQQAGTTRDINRVEVRYHNRTIQFLDTAGIRRSGKIEQGVEQFSVLRALAAIEEADICLLVMDTAELNVQLDQKIAGLIKEAGRGLILVVNKWDMEENKDTLILDITAQLASNFAFVPWAPLIFISATTGQNVAKIYDLVLEVQTARRETFKTSELNRWLQQAVNAHSPVGLKGYHPQLHYIVQEEGEHLPSFKIFGSYTKYLHWSYKRYLEKQFREHWPLIGTPLKFWFIEKKS